MNAQSKYDKINLAFERAVNKLENNLEYLIDNDKVSPKFIALQKLIIKALKDFQDQTESIIDYLLNENTKLLKQHHREIKKLTDIKEAFEALCIIHGIMDLIAWMNKGKNYLVAEAVEQHKNGEFTIPYLLQLKIESLDITEKQFIKNILFKRSEKTIRNNIENLNQSNSYVDPKVQY